MCAIRAANENGEFLVLPYQGQQIWRMSFLGHDLTMKSMFEDPIPTQLFHANYGMFLLHCGLTAMGNPTSQDTHPQHGELPFAPFSDAYLTNGEDERGKFLCVGGRYRHTRAFRTDYLFEVFYKLYETATTIEVNVKFTNLRPDSLEYFYMCHINFRPVDGSRLSYSAYHKDIHPHYALSSRLSEEKKQAYNTFFEKLQKMPEIQDVVDKDSQMYEPEICSTVHYQHDADGYAYCMQVLPGRLRVLCALCPGEASHWSALDCTHRSRGCDGDGSSCDSRAPRLHLLQAAPHGKLSSRKRVADLPN